MSEPRDLETIQRWFQAVVTHPLGVKDGIASSDARSLIEITPGDVEEVVAPSRARTGVERLSVYANAYFARLLECMRAYFPALVQALGQDLFDEFAFGYLQRYPSQTYTLNRLADRFVAYLEETRPTPGDDDDWCDFVIDLARLELTIDHVFDGPGVENETPISPESLQAVAPEVWPASTLTPAPCLQLLAFQFSINDYYTSFRRGEEPPPPPKENSFAAITRRDYVVRRYPLNATQFDLLSALVAKKTIGEAIEQAARSATDLDELAGQLHAWFRRWASEGFFMAVNEPS